MIDAPVSGGSEGAALGTLSIMVGGDPDDVRRAMPYPEAMGGMITHVGPTGAGQRCKLVNQILVVVTMLGVAEALLFAQAGGLDLERTLQAVGGGAGGSRTLSNRGSQAVHRDWRPRFPSTCSKRTCAWCWRPPTSWACRCSPPARSSSSTARCRARVWAARATTPW